MAEVLFYHLDRQPLEKVLPELLEKCLERGWRAVVQVGSEERRDALDAHLWTYRDEAFLPHGTAREGNPEAQPIWLTADGENPNGAQVRFLTDGAGLPEIKAYERAVVVFDGNDADAVASARLTWTSARGEGHAVTYWQQSGTGRWEKKG